MEVFFLIFWQISFTKALLFLLYIIIYQFVLCRCAILLSEMLTFLKKFYPDLQLLPLQSGSKNTTSNYLSIFIIHFTYNFVSNMFNSINITQFQLQLQSLVLREVVMSYPPAAFNLLSTEFRSLENFIYPTVPVSLCYSAHHVI